MRTFINKTETVKIGELDPGMRLMENLRCVRSGCQKHAANKVIDPELKEGRELTEYDIIKIQRDYECLFTTGFRIFETKEEILEFVKERDDKDYGKYTVIMIHNDFRELRTETLSSLFQIANEVERKKGIQVKIASANEYLFKIQRAKESKREIRSFLKKLKSEIKNVYNEVELSTKGNSDPLPPALVSETYETIRNSRAIFERIANTTIMRDLQNDERDSFYEGIHNHIYNVALTAAKIVYNMSHGKNVHMEQVFLACIFLDIGIPLARRTGCTLEKHPLLGSNFFILYLKKLDEIIRSRENDAGGDMIPVIPLDKTTLMNLKMGKTIIDYHHERMNGSGYPHKLQDFQRTQEMDRLVAIIDEFYHMTGTVNYHSDQPTQINPMSRCKAIRELEKKASDRLFDERLVNIFKKHVFPYPLYSHVLLNGGEEAVVTELNPGMMDRPVVYSLDKRKEINLAHIENTSIEIRPDEKYCPESIKREVAVDITIRKKKNRIKIELDEGYICPRCRTPLGDELPPVIGSEFSLAECLIERKTYQVCKEGHFSLLYIEPPENCSMIECRQGENCSADWKVLIECI